MKPHRTESAFRHDLEDTAHHARTKEANRRLKARVVHIDTSEEDSPLLYKQGHPLIAERINYKRTGQKQYETFKGTEDEWVKYLEEMNEKHSKVIRLEARVKGGVKHVAERPVDAKQYKLHVNFMPWMSNLFKKKVGPKVELWARLVWGAMADDFEKTYGYEVVGGAFHNRTVLHFEFYLGATVPGKLFCPVKNKEIEGRVLVKNPRDVGTNRKKWIDESEGAIGILRWDKWIPGVYPRDLVNKVQTRTYERTRMNGGMLSPSYYLAIKLDNKLAKLAEVEIASGNKDFEAGLKEELAMWREWKKKDLQSGLISQLEEANKEKHCLEIENRALRAQIAGKGERVVVKESTYEAGFKAGLESGKEIGLAESRGIIVSQQKKIEALSGNKSIEDVLKEKEKEKEELVAKYEKEIRRLSLLANELQVKLRSSGMDID